MVVYPVIGVSLMNAFLMHIFGTFSKHSWATREFLLVRLRGEKKGISASVFVGFQGDLNQSLLRPSSQCLLEADIRTAFPVSAIEQPLS